MHPGEIVGVMLHAFELINDIAAAHVPIEVTDAFEHHFCNGRGPTAAADDRYLSTSFHSLRVFRKV